MSRGSSTNDYGYLSIYSNPNSQLSPDQFTLKIRQQPIQTRQSTSNERDRRPLDPPPIVQIELENATVQETQNFLQNPYFFMCVSLVHSSTHEEVISVTQNALSGQTSSSMYKLKDINNHDGGFFVFGDVSVKLEGQFRLKFSVFEITQLGATNLQSIYSNVFQVYSSKSFPGMLESTFLSRSFSDQGVRIRIRKEHRVQMTGSRKRKSSYQEESMETDQSRQQYTHPTSHGHHSTHYQNQQQWASNAPNDSSAYYRRSSMNSIKTVSKDISGNSRRLSHIDRRPSVPFSPPHQPYDNSRVFIGSNDFYNHHDQINQRQQQYLRSQQRHQNGLIPSPPPQLTFFKPELRRMSSDYSFTNGRRQSADPHFYHPVDPLHREARRMSLQPYSSQEVVHLTSNPESEVIHLPPLRSITTNHSPLRGQQRNDPLSPLPMPKYPYQQSNGVVEVDAAVAMMQLATKRQTET